MTFGRLVFAAPICAMLACSAASGSMTSAAPPGGSGARTIQEADIYKLVGNTLYILNAKRSGLQIVDVTNVASPQLVATVPTASSPRQIYVVGNTAYVLTSNAKDVDCGGYQGVCGWNTPGGVSTQVDVIDVTSPAAPKVLGTQQILGRSQDSRIVGHVLYVAGIDATASNTLVASYDVSDPQAFKKIAEADFAFGDWDIGVFLNVTDTRIVVAQTGDTCDLVHDQGSCSDAPVTQFVPIDITDPNGALTLGTPFLGDGVVWDRWAMDFDPQSGIFRAVMSSDWNGNAGGGMLAVWSAPTTTAAPTQLGTLKFTTGDHVTAAAFAGPRVYVSSNTSATGCPDPVVVFDTTNPAKPAQAGSVAVPGVNDFLYPDGSQLISPRPRRRGDQQRVRARARLRLVPGQRAARRLALRREQREQAHAPLAGHLRRGPEHDRRQPQRPREGLPGRELARSHHRPVPEHRPDGDAGSERHAAHRSLALEPRLARNGGTPRPRRARVPGPERHRRVLDRAPCRSSTSPTAISPSRRRSSACERHPVSALATIFPVAMPPRGSANRVPARALGEPQEPAGGPELERRREREDRRRSRQPQRGRPRARRARLRRRLVERGHTFETRQLGSSVRGATKATVKWLTAAGSSL